VGFETHRVMVDGNQEGQATWSRIDPLALFRVCSGDPDLAPTAIILTGQELTHGGSIEYP